MIALDQVVSKLKPGLMCREAPAGPKLALYDPISDVTTTLAASDAAAPGELGVTDLESDDRAWRNGRLDVGIYHASQRVRAHVDAAELNFEINYACEYSCRHCFQTLAPASDPIAAPGWAEIERTAVRIATGSPREVSVTGGDIFLHPRAHDAIEALLDRIPKATVRILVNGGALDLDDRSVLGRLERWAAHRVIVKSDFFAHTAALHDHFTRTPGSFAKLVRVVRTLREIGVACLPAAALTRWNFETRFDLVGFLDELTEDHFTVSTIVYPTNRRSPAELAGIRLTPPQWRELMEERFFAPLAAEYHTLEEQCGGDCQFAVVSADGRSWGCSFLRPTAAMLEESRSLPLEGSVAAWRAWAVPRAVHPDCPTCPARATCRRCPSFLGGDPRTDDYCTISRLAQEAVARRIGRATSEGFRFLHAAAGLRAASTAR